MAPYHRKRSRAAATILLIMLSVLIAITAADLPPLSLLLGGHYSQFSIRSAADSGLSRSLVFGNDDAFEGGMIQLECVPSAAPPARCYSTAWLLNGARVLVAGGGQPDIAQDIRMEQAARVSSITLLGTTLLASGLYTCYQTCIDADGNWFLSEGRRLATVYTKDVYNNGLAFRHGAKLLSGFAPLTVGLGGRMVFQCHATANTNTYYTLWRHNRRFIHARKGRRRVDPLLGGLRIQNATMRDAGHFSCLTQNEKGGDQADFNVKVLTSSNSTHMLNNTVIVNVHGPRVLRHSHTGKYWCSGRSINQRTVNISWTLPNGFRRVSSASGAWNSITVQNVNAEADSRVKLACTVTESSAGYVLPLSKGFLVVQSQDTLLPRPRKIIFSDRRLLLRVQPPRAFPNIERERIIGICFHIHTTSWTWTRKIFSLYSGLVRRKYRLSGLVYDQLDLLKRMLHTDVEVSVWYMDKYGQGQQRSLTFRINDVPPLLTYARATRLPGQPGTIRVQWDHPRDLADAHQFPDYLRNLRLSAAWSDVSNASGATTWSSSRQVSLVDMSTTRSITFRNLSPSGVFRFKVWINEVGKPRRLFPMLVKNLVSFLDASPESRDLRAAGLLDVLGQDSRPPTHGLQFSVTLRGQMTCSQQQQIREATVALEVLAIEHLNSLCMDCEVISQPQGKMYASNSSCNSTLNSFNYSLAFGVTVNMPLERPMCSFLDGVKASLQRDGRNALVMAPSLGQFSMTHLCGRVGRVIACLHADNDQQTALGQTAWRISDRSRSRNFCSG